MFLQVHKPKEGENKGSCTKLANYLNKEENYSYFNQDNNMVSLIEVVGSVDSNVKALGKDDDKFYMLSINPSQAELQHILGRETFDINSLSQQEADKMEIALREYTRNVMDVYAENFGRDKVKSGKDLLYFARIETERKYKYYDNAVLEGKKQAGELKGGLNYHIHVIVSRKNLEGKIKLSPLAKSAGNEWKLENRGTVKRGFSHENFKIKGQEKFNSLHNFTSPDAYIRPEKTQEEILNTKGINQDLKDCLSWDMQNSNHLSYLMKEKGYKYEFQQGKNIFTKNNNKEITYIENVDLKQFINPYNPQKLKEIAKNFNQYKFECNPTEYKQKQITVEERSFEDNEQKKRKYYVLHDSESKISVNLTTVKTYAKENKIDLTSRKYLDTVENNDLRESLNYNVRNLNEVKTLMKWKGYDMEFEQGKIIFSKNEVPLMSVKTEISYQSVMGFIEYGSAMREQAIYDFSYNINVNDISNKDILKQNNYERVQVPAERNLKEELLKNLETKGNCVLKSRTNFVPRDTCFIVDKQTKNVFNVSQYQAKICPTNYTRESILSETKNIDLQDILKNNSFQNANQVVFLMEQKGYEIAFEYGKYNFTKDEQTTQLAQDKINIFRSPVNEEALTKIAQGFKQYEFDLNPQQYKQDNIKVEAKTFVDDDQKEHKYYVLHESESKTSINLSTLKEFAKENKIDIQDFRVENILKSISNEDLKETPAV